jgi:hypothetical protein
MTALTRQLTSWLTGRQALGMLRALGVLRALTVLALTLSALRTWPGRCALVLTAVGGLRTRSVLALALALRTGLAQLR